MAIRSSTSTGIPNSTTAITGVKPTGSVAGDRLLAWITSDGAVYPDPPSGEGWALLATASTASPADVNTVLLYEKKVSDGAETFAFVNSTGKAAIIQVVALTGRHASDAAVVGTPTNGNTPAASPLSVAISGVTALAGDDVLWFGQIDQNARTDTWSFGAISGYTQLQNDAGSDWSTSGCFAKANVSAGATGTLTSSATQLTGSGNAAWSGVVVSIPTGATGPTVSTITGTTATEGSAVVFTVTMSGTGGLTDAYSWSGTAGSGDYTQTLTDGMFTTTGGSGSVTVSGGNIVVPSAVTEFTVTIPTTGDTLDEDAETIRLVFGGVTASSGTINDDDAQPTVTISDATEVAGTVTFVATLSAASGKTITFVADTANGTKTAGVDYTALTGSTVTFNPGETTKNIVVTAL